MRRWERIVSLVAVLGVLLHAGLLVRHNGVMLDAAFDRVALAFAGEIICHDDSGNTRLGPSAPHHSGKLPHCPVCVGAVAAAAILPPEIILPAPVPAASAKTVITHRRVGRRPYNIRPPSRAPPATIRSA